MKFQVPARAAATGELRLRFRRIPVQSCVVKVYRGHTLLASGHIYGRGEGSNAQEQIVLPLRFAPGSVAANETLSLEASTLPGTPLGDDGLELLEAT